MSSLCKKFTLILIFVLFVLALLVESCVAPVVTPVNPSPAPEIVSVDIQSNPWDSANPWDAPPDDFKRKEGYTMSRGNVTITIKNRPFTPYIDENGNQINIYYIIWWKLSSDNDFISWCSRSLYQSGSTYTSCTLPYGVEGILPISAEYIDGGQVIDFRVQAVTGYFRSGLQSLIYEGEGSAFTEFSITIPKSDKPGSSKPNIKPTSVIPLPSNSNNSSQQNLSRSNLTNFVFVGIITVLLAVIVYLLCSRQRKPKPVLVDGESSYVMNTNG